MKERLRHIKGILNRFTKRGSSHKASAIASEKFISIDDKDLQGEKDMNVATTKVANPFYNTFPDLFGELSPETNIQITNELIVIIPSEVIKDDQAIDAVERWMGIEKEKGHKVEIFPNLEISDIELDDLSLEIRGPPELSNLLVLIQDFENKSLYWMRRLKTEQRPVKIRNKEINIVGIDNQRMEIYERVPCPEQDLESSVEFLVARERNFSAESPKQAAIQAVVGVARYQGNKNLSLDVILRLTVLKFNQIRKDYEAGNL